MSVAPIDPTASTLIMSSGQVVQCTPGHEHDCQAAVNPVCTCACNGVYHSILLTNPRAQIHTPKKELIVECGVCGRPAGYNDGLMKWCHKDNVWADMRHNVQPKRNDGMI